MARLINNEILFIHIAKTGGTFFRESINAYGIPNVEVGEKHASLKVIEEQYPNMTYKKIIAFIRAPHSWYRSRWAFAKMTYFKEKILYMPEAQKHWMAKVWDDDLNKFVANTIERYPKGIATEYFSEMLSGTNSKHVSVLKYENIKNEIRDVINSTGSSDLLPVNIVNKRPLDSSKIGGEISPSLLKEIASVEYLIYNKYY